MKERIILFGGAFDPIHNGHLKLASEASNLLDADLYFILTKKPRWKETLASDLDRLEMLKVALNEVNNPRFHLSTCELERDDEETYTSDTIRYFLDKFPDKELILLIGGDQVNLFSSWFEAEFIKDHAQIYFLGREGYLDPSNNREKFQMKELKGVGVGDVSSSKIRNLEEIDLPLGVLSYIHDHHLYYMKKVEKYLSTKRLKHSLSVALLSYEIALKNSLPLPGRAYIAGLLHDIGKEIDEKEVLSLVNKEVLSSLPKWAYHQYSGEKIAERDFFIKDKDILEAIESHCTGKANMNDIAKIVYASDKIDPSRGWDSTKFVQACLNDYQEGFKLVLKANKEFLLEKGSDPNSIKLSKECFEFYLKEEE